MCREVSVCQLSIDERKGQRRGRRTETEYWRCYVYIGIVMLLCFDTRVNINIDTIIRIWQTNYSGIENSAMFETKIERGYLF